MPAFLLAIAFVTSVNSLKLLLIILFAAGLLALGRWSSKIAATSQDFPAHTPTPDASLTVPQHAPTVPQRWAWQPHYDWEDIRRAVVSRIKADHEFFNNSEDTGDESL